MRLTTICTAAVAALAGLAATGCGQDEIEGPEPGSSGEVSECGGFYPGEVSPDGDSDEDDLADAGVSYGSALGDTLPCFVWTSVRAGEYVEGADPATYANAYLSMPEIYLKSREPEMASLLEAQFGVTEANVILFAIASTNCGACPDLMTAVAASKAELLAEGVIPVGVLSFDLNDMEMTDSWDLITADNQIIEDGFDEAFYRTNDPEHFLGLRSDYDAFPYVLAVRVSDMKVAVRDYGTNFVNYDNSTFMVSELVAAVESFVAE